MLTLRPFAKMAIYAIQVTKCALSRAIRTMVAVIRVLRQKRARALWMSQIKLSWDMPANRDGRTGRKSSNQGVLMDLERKIIFTDKAPPAVGPYSQAVRIGDWIFCSGQVALTTDGTFDESMGVAQQARQALNNVSVVLEKAGSSLGQVVKTTVFLTDMGDFKTVNGVYSEFFSADPPARSCIQVAGLPLGAAVEIEVVARA